MNVNFCRIPEEPGYEMLEGPRTTNEQTEVPQTVAFEDVPREQTNGHASTSQPIPQQLSQSPQEVATADRVYWSCPGHNKLKVWHVLITLCLLVFSW